MTFRPLKSMAHDDDKLYDLSKGMPEDYEPPEYPTGLSFTLPQSVLDEVGAEDGDPDDMLHFALMGEVTSVFRGRDDSRVELRVTQFAGEDGRFVDVNDDEDRPWLSPTICLCEPDLDKLDLEADCEIGDTLHLIGTVRMESMSNDGLSGEQVRLQITELTVEDESGESREG